MNLSEPFIRRPVMTAVLTLSVILFGTLSYFQLPVNDLPAVDYPVIQVQVGYPGASPDTVANNIATPLERQFMQINGLEVVTSKSTQGVATFTLQFALEKNIDAAATDVQTAISQAIGSLPADLPSPPTYSKSNPNDQPIMYIALTSESVGYVGARNLDRRSECRDQERNELHRSGPTGQQLRNRDSAAAGTTRKRRPIQQLDRWWNWSVTCVSARRRYGQRFRSGRTREHAF